MFESPRSLSFHSEIEHKHWERRCLNLSKSAAFLHDRGKLSRNPCSGLTFPALKFWMLIKFDFSSKTGILVVKFAFATANLKIETLLMRRRFARVLFPFRKQAIPFLTVDAIIGNQAFQNGPCYIRSSVGLDKVKTDFSLLMELKCTHQMLNFSYSHWFACG